jgi:hypothetical protein
LMGSYPIHFSFNFAIYPHFYKHYHLITSFIEV